jgi:MoaA/NifB/PqqE/SkfB family radical SAM enzyme
MNNVQIWKNLLKNRFISHTPYILSHKLTSRCNSKCEICDLWKYSKNYKNDLTKEEIYNILRLANKAGFIQYVAWGGEPLLRKDLAEIFCYAKKMNLITSLITNGMYLKEKYKQIKPFTDHISVSIDSPDEQHDAMRNTKDLFENAIEGIKEVKKQKTTGIQLCSVISKLNLNKVEKLIHFSNEINVPIIFEPIALIEDYNEKILLNKDELNNAFSTISSYKRQGYPIINSKKYLKIITKNQPYSCHIQNIFLEMDSQGNLKSCLDNKWGNIQDTSFKNLFDSDKYQNFMKNIRKCNFCKVTCIIEYSLLYSFYPELIMQRMKYLLK